MHDTRQSFLGKVITTAGLPQTAELLDVLVAVAAEEGTSALWNPLATTMVYGGSTPLPGNSADVQDYTTEANGVKATAATLHNGNYGAFMALAGQGVDDTAMITAWAESKWGTFHNEDGSPNVNKAIEVLMSVKANRSEYYGAAVSGPDDPEPAPVPEPEPVGVNVNVPQLSNGSTGGAVKAVQAILNQKFNASPALTVDGQYGPKTIATVEAFQRAHGLSVDGVAGTQTWAELVA